MEPRKYSASFNSHSNTHSNTNLNIDSNTGFDSESIPSCDSDSIFKLNSLSTFNAGSNSVPISPDSETTQVIRQMYGPISDLALDSKIEEIWINSPARIFFARAGKTELARVVMTSVDVRNLVERLLQWSGRRLDTSSPLVDARLPDGSRLHAAIPEITARNWSINIRKHLLNKSTLSDLVSNQSINEELQNLLTGSVNAGLNILVSGATQAGKTTFLNALINQIPVKERVITIEEVFELSPNLSDHVGLQTRPANIEGEGEINMRRLVKESLRMRPNRLIIGEVREAEALDLLIALNSGLPGMATIHANSGKSAIAKLQMLPLLAGENISSKFITKAIASSINLVVHCHQLPSGARKVYEVVALTGRAENEQIESMKLARFDSSANDWQIETSNWQRFLNEARAN